MLGFGSLDSASDLLAKLESDLELLLQQPGDSYVAYNFFATADHIVDWLFPGPEGSAAAVGRQSMRRTDALLCVVSQIATGAIHLQPRGRRGGALTHVDDLIVVLSGEAASRFGCEVSAFALAASVVRYWQAHPRLR